MRIPVSLLALVTGALLMTTPALAQAPDPHAGHDHGAAPAAGARDRGGAPAARDPHEGHGHAPGAHGVGSTGRGKPAPLSATPGKRTAPEDMVEGSGKGMALLFWLFALSCIGGSIFVITRRNLIAAVMGMVGTFFAVAALYMMLYAHFLSVVQMLVYAGAIMVLFVFVIMVLNKPEDEPWVDKRSLAGKVLALVAMAYLVLRLAGVLWSVVPPDPIVAAAAPAPVVVQIPRQAQEVYDWGSTAAVGRELFTAGLFPFEAISILLLIAVVGAIAIARPLKNDSAEAPAGAQR